MGAASVRLFLANGGRLSDGAYRLGVFLSYHSLDADPLYKHGWRYAAELCYPDKKPEAARTAFSRAVRELQAFGFLEVHAASGPKHPAVYRVHPAGTHPVET